MFYSLNLDDNTIKILENMGIELECIFKEVGIPTRMIDSGKCELTTQQYKAVLDVLDLHAKPEFMVEISKVDYVASFNPEFFAGLCAENGLECIKRIAKYKTIVAPIRMTVKDEGDAFRISYAYSDGSAVPKTMVFYAQISLLSLLRRGTGIETLTPKKVIGGGMYPDQAKSYIGTIPVVSEGQNALVFSKTDLLRPFITKNNRMWDYLEGELNQRLRDFEQDLSFAATVRKALIELLPSGVSDADKISHELGLSKRTLQRRLKDEQTSFNKQLNRTRELLVRNYLKMNMTLDEIAFLVSYSDAKSLSRAFKMWTGMSVTEYRSDL